MELLKGKWCVVGVRTVGILVETRDAADLGACGEVAGRLHENEWCSLRKCLGIWRFRV